MSKFFIASIDLTRPQVRELAIDSKIQILEQLIEKAMYEAEKIGKNTSTIVVLPEYALVHKEGLSREDKGFYLKKLQEIVNKHENLVLIPGTVVSHGKLDEEEKIKKIAKISANYEKILGQVDFESARDRQHFIEEYENFKKVIASEEDLPILHNRAYILTKDNKIKHDKTRPIRERTIVKDSGFFMGSDKYVHDISLENGRFDLGLLICFEHADSYINRRLMEEKPLVEVVVAEGKSPSKELFGGALNIHVNGIGYYGYNRTDVFLNDKNELFHDIERVVAEEYSVFSDEVSDPTMESIVLPDERKFKVEINEKLDYTREALEKIEEIGSKV